VSENLAVISGVVTELVIHAGEEEFVRSLSDQVVGTGAAAGLAAAGLAGAAAGDSVEFFSCKVSGRFVQGCFSKVTFKDDEKIKFVVSEEPQSLVLAAQRITDHTVLMAPHCSRGKKAHALFAWVLVVRLFAGFLMAGALFVVLMEYTTASSPF
jgi:hypothetical protein